MHAFLDDIAGYLSEKYKNRIQDLCIVFPNKRARLYFNQFLTQKIQKPVWSPGFYTINEFIQEITGKKTADNLSLVFELYRTYEKVTHADQQFDEFYFFCEMLLADFDDIDKYLVDPGDIFRNLSDLKNIDDTLDYLNEQQLEVIRKFWKTFQSKEISEHQQGFVSLWEVLFRIYTAFNKRLDELDLSYEGKLFREAAGLIKEGDFPGIEYEKVIFAGFNALNACEKKIFRHLNTAGKAMFFWDYDEYYINNQSHEAGYFLRGNIRDFPPPEDFRLSGKLTGQGRNITFVSASSVTGQVKILPDLLGKNNSGGDLAHDTAIVLADEKILLPALHSLPENLSGLNVSMGYPFRETPAFSLIEILLDLQKNAVIKQDEVYFYYKDVLAFINHQYVIGIFRDDIMLLRKRIIDESRIRMTPGDLMINDLFRNVFARISGIKDYPLYLTGIFELVIRYSREQEVRISSVHTEFIFHLFTYLKRLHDVIDRSGITITVITFRKLLYKLLQNLTVPFSGEPLKGLQVMGILETRALDFNTLVLLSMNEGIYPKSGSTPSFIPYNLRKGFGLPTVEHQDAIYAYYFYRLLQRAQNIYMVYNSQPGGTFTGERSRFMHQIYYEKIFNVNEISYGLHISIPKSASVSVKKYGAVLEKLMAYTVEGKSKLTPSALNAYIDCSLKFYFRYIAGIREPEELSEDTDLPAFGNILHGAMNTLYTPFKGTHISKDDIALLLKSNKYKTDKAIDNAFRDEYFRYLQPGDTIPYAGRQMIIREVIKNYVQQILRVDQTIAPFGLVALEKWYDAKFGFSLKGVNRIVRIGGIIDRVDEVDGMIRVIDYKTGKIMDSFRGIDSLFEYGSDKRNYAVFQIFLYSMLLMDNGFGNILPGLYFIRDFYGHNAGHSLYESYGSGKKSVVTGFRNYYAEFKDQLIFLLEHLFNTGEPFRQTENSEICRFCSYRKICHRGG